MNVWLIELAFWSLSDPVYFSKVLNFGERSIIYCLHKTPTKEFIEQWVYAQSKDYVVTRSDNCLENVDIWHVT